MKKIVLTVAGALAFLVASCASLPDAARKLDLNVDSVTFANENNVEGFNVEYTVHHNSSAPMPIENVKIEIAINGRKAAIYENDKSNELPNRVNNHFKVFVPANLTYSVAKDSMKHTPMLQMIAEATVTLIVDDDKDSSAATFNVTKKLKGVIHRGQSN